MSEVYERLTTAEDVSDTMHANRQVDQSDDDGESWHQIKRVLRPDNTMRCPIQRVSTALKNGSLFRARKR